MFLHQSSLQVTIKTNLLAELKHQAPNFNDSTSKTRTHTGTSHMSIVYNNSKEHTDTCPQGEERKVYLVRCRVRRGIETFLRRKPQPCLCCRTWKEIPWCRTGEVHQSSVRLVGPHLYYHSVHRSRETQLAVLVSSERTHADFSPRRVCSRRVCYDTPVRTATITTAARYERIMMTAFLCTCIYLPEQTFNPNPNPCPFSGPTDAVGPVSRANLWRVRWPNGRR